MIVLAVLVLGVLSARVAGWAGARSLASWEAAVRVGLAAMLMFTASVDPLPDGGHLLHGRV